MLLPSEKFLVPISLTELSTPQWEASLKSSRVALSISAMHREKQTISKQLLIYEPLLS